jgi:hypothetical protein
MTRMTRREHAPAAAQAAASLKQSDVCASDDYSAGANGMDVA